MKTFHQVLNTFTLIVGFVTSVTYGQSSVSPHLTLGNPSGAVTSTSAPTNFLMVKKQYVLSYHRDHGTPNWVCWHLGSEDLGTAPRSDNFRPDPALPSGWYRVTDTSYVGSGYDRGHMCPSADRTSTTLNNSATFLLTNIVPQAPDNNQGPWARLEDYCRSLIALGNELYIISGGSGAKATIDGGHIIVPARTWKIIVVIRKGSNDLQRVTTATRVIAVDFPNQPGIRGNDWRSYRTTVDAIERSTGYNFLSLVPSNVQAVIEARVDNQ